MGDHISGVGSASASGPGAAHLQNLNRGPAPSNSSISAAMGGCSVYVDSVKGMVESVGIGNLQDEGAKELAEDVTYRLRHILQDATKFMIKAKRTKLTTQDLDFAFKIKNIEPIYGMQDDTSGIPFRFVSGGGREIHFVEEKESDIIDLLNYPQPKVPYEPSIRSHWLAIEGIQPEVPENPPLVSRDSQRLEGGDSSGKGKGGRSQLRSGPYTPTVGKPLKFKNAEQVLIKQLATHELSVEQQLYYKEITEACVGSDEGKRTEALHSLTNDPGLYEMLPRLCTFISEGVRVNVVQNLLAMLIYLMRMVKALLDNPTLYLEKYLHDLIPSVTTCIISKQLCNRPEADNHWALRDFAAKLLGIICRNYNTTINSVQGRVSEVFANALINEKTPLASIYGALVGLNELGPGSIKTFVVPRIKEIGIRLEFCLEGVGHTQADKLASEKIKNFLLRIVPPVLKSTRPTPDILDNYKLEFGFLSVALHDAVVQLRAQSPKPSALTTPPGKVKISTTPGINTSTRTIS